MEATSFRWDGNPVHWRGEPSFQLPSDLIHMQEIVFRKKPEWIVETGGGGGTTWFLSDVCNLLEYGRVLPIREDSLDSLPRSLEGEVMVILDSDVYSEEHMHEEIRLYAPLVTRGQSLVVCHTDRSDWGTQPALRRYLDSNPDMFSEEHSPVPSMNSYLIRRGGLDPP